MWYDPVFDSCKVITDTGEPVFSSPPVFYGIATNIQML
jgi:hypothetical protein